MRVNAPATILTFYDRINDQFSKKEGSMNPLISNGYYAFQIFLPDYIQFSDIEEFEIIDEFEVSLQLDLNSLKVYSTGSKSWVVFYETTFTGNGDYNSDYNDDHYIGSSSGGALPDLDPGLYYYRVKIKGRDYFSEHFRVLDHDCINRDYTKIVWSNKGDIYNTLYQIEYENIYYSKGKWVMNTPTIEHTGIENAMNGKLTITKSIYTDHFEFSDIVKYPDVPQLRMMNFHSEIFISIRNNDHQLSGRKLINPNIEDVQIEWLEDNGLFALIRIVLNVDNIVKGGCGGDFILM